MNHSIPTSRFAFQDPDDCDRLRDLLNRVGYMDSRVLDTIGINDLSTIHDNSHPLLLERTSGGSPLHTIIRLFLMEMAVKSNIVEKAIEPMTVAAWQEAGLVHCRDNKVIAAVKLLPFQNLVLAFDFTSIMQTPLRENYVMGIGSSTITLSNLTIRRQSRRTLDLGTGCGVHAFLATPHSDQCVAVDLNPRAVQLAQFNAKLNKIPNIECLHGDFFTPVKDQKFDLIISNPPFVISPETRFIYRDGGMEADAVTRKIVQEAPRFLHEGGFCQILCNWAELEGQDWQKKLENWFEGSGCDAWVMRSESLTAATYASTWIKHTELFDQKTAFAERFRKWMAYYEKLGIESVGAGLITMRKREGQANWFRADQSPEKMNGPCGESIAQGFELRDFLETVQNDDDLLNSNLRHSPDIRLEQQYEPADHGWKATTSVISLAQGFAYTGNSDPFIANLLISCDGHTPLKERIPGLADSLGVDAAQLTPTLCPLIRKLIEQGFILPGNQVLNGQ